MHKIKVVIIIGNPLPIKNIFNKQNNISTKKTMNALKPLDPPTKRQRSNKIILKTKIIFFLLLGF